MALVIAIEKAFRVVIAVIVNTVVWRAPTSVKVGGGSCSTASFQDPDTHRHGVSKGGAPIMGDSRVGVITECDGNPLLVKDYLNRCGLGLVVVEGLLLDIRHKGTHPSVL